ncbi:hypothetical protein ACRAWG_31340 [Methylobacterium sp. P31]
MNAQHPIRTLHGHLARVAPSLDALQPEEPLPSDIEARVRLECSLTIFDQIAESAMIAVDQLERATNAGAGTRSDYLRLEDVAAKLSSVAWRTEGARARLSSKLAGVR